MPQKIPRPIKAPAGKQQPTEGRGKQGKGAGRGQQWQGREWKAFCGVHQAQLEQRLPGYHFANLVEDVAPKNPARVILFTDALKANAVVVDSGEGSTGRDPDRPWTQHLWTKQGKLRRLLLDVQANAPLKWEMPGSICEIAMLDDASPRVAPRRMAVSPMTLVYYLGTSRTGSSSNAPPWIQLAS